MEAQDLRRRLAQLRRQAPIYAARRPFRRRIAVVYGNCQGTALRAMLSESKDFSREFLLVEVPEVYMIQRHHLARLRWLLERATMLITQEVQDDYRNMPIGTEQISAQLSPRAKVVRIPVLYYEGLHPFQVNVRVGEDLSTPAPLTSYHDLRFLHAASRGMDLEDAAEWLSEFRAPMAALRANSEDSLLELRRREEGLDVIVASTIKRDPRSHGRSFYTVNHPANFLLLDEVCQVHHLLGLPQPTANESEEYLTSLMAPVESDVADALRLSDPPSVKDWTIEGRKHSVESLLAEHLKWYRRRPDVVASGARQHADKMNALGLG